MFEIVKSTQFCFKTGNSHFENGVQYFEVVIPLDKPNKQGNMGVIQWVRADSIRSLKD